MKPFKADLHLHSNHSNKPVYWAMRKFNVPESYTQPMTLYKKARERGMDYVTITDHNSINGALEISHLPGTFISSEITAHFPENGCKVHVVVLDISENDFSTIMNLRKNIYEMLAYLRTADIVHFLAHPLYAQNEKLDLAIIEKSLLLFTVFEVKNGCRAGRFNNFTKCLVSALSEHLINNLAEKHRLAPYGEIPWKKSVVGGSDDHGGLFIASAHTTVHDSATIKEFIDGIRNGKSCADGDDGGALTMAHSMYGIAHAFYSERLKGGKKSNTPFVSMLLDRFFNSGEEKSSFLDKIKIFLLKNLPLRREYAERKKMNFEEILDTEARILLDDAAFLESIRDIGNNRRIFAVVSRLANRLIYHYTNRLMTLTPGAGFFDYLNTAGTIGLIHALISPYYLAFHHQNRGKELISEIAGSIPELRHDGQPEKIALFTDTLDEINGVAITIKRLINTAFKRGIELTVITTGEDVDGSLRGVKKFRSVGDFVIPEYPELKLRFPPVLDLLDFVEREGFTRIHISTPGTMGLLGILIGRIMSIPVAGTYHTDIPQYVRALTNDEFLENAAWSYMIWFYGQMEEIMTPSSGTRQQLVARGIPGERMKPLPRWVDTLVFNPCLRDKKFWIERGAKPGEIILLYVGRVSREKGVELLADAFMELVLEGETVTLAVVGDGPYREEMQASLYGYPAIFTGYLTGMELQSAYASSDIFVFPSATDTFGNVVLEAQASGLPVIVSDEGGPGELMIDGETGLIFRASDRISLVSAIKLLTSDSPRISTMGSKARSFTLDKAPEIGQNYSSILGTAGEIPD